MYKYSWHDLYQKLFQSSQIMADCFSVMLSVNEDGILKMMWYAFPKRFFNASPYILSVYDLYLTPL